MERHLGDHGDEHTRKAQESVPQVPQLDQQMSR